MKFVVCLAVGSILAALVLNAVSAAVGLDVAGKEIWFGMLGPALAAVVTHVAVELQRRQNPEKILKRLIQAFVVKFLFFGAYIVFLLKTSLVRPEVFACCFVLFYLALHMAEAYGLYRARTGLTETNDDGRW